MSMVTQQPVSLETVKAILKTYSRFMRRDFLAILVKMSAKHFNVRTVRCDWRTRSGMLAFMQTVWERFYPLLSQDTVFRWYCTNFDSQEKVFSNRKLMMFIYSNWNTYSGLLQQEETLAFLKANQNEAEIILANPKTKHTTAWSTPVGQQLLELINDFASNKALQNQQRPGPPTPSMMRKSISMPSMQQLVMQQPAMQQQVHHHGPPPVPLPPNHVMRQVSSPVNQVSSPVNQVAAPEIFPHHLDFFQVDEPVNHFAPTTPNMISPGAAYDSDVSVDDIFDTASFEMNEYNQQDMPSIFPMDYPYSIDLYSL